MMKRSLLILGGIAGMTSLPGVVAQEPASPPAIRIRLSRPDQQLKEVLELFQGAKSANPAAALAAWKRASPEPNRLGKPLEALIAAFNPRMVDELKALDAAEVSIRFDSETGQPRWSAILPRDDGTFAALAPALVLSGGSIEAPLEGIAVDRLGGPGSPLMTKMVGGTLLASHREELKRARTRLETAGGPEDKTLAEVGSVSLAIGPDSLKGSKSLAIRQLEELIKLPENDVLDRLAATLNGSISVHQRRLQTSIRFDGARRLPQTVIDASWYDWIPKGRALAGFALSTDPTATSWKALFELIDRVEKVDPANANQASIQVRLELVGRLVGFRPEADVLRHLQGISGWVGADGKQIDGALLIFHLDEPTTAERIVKNLKPLRGSANPPQVDGDQPRVLGQVDGKNLRISRIDKQVLLTWGEGILEASLIARDNPERSEGPAIKAGSRPGSPSIGGGAFWPGRLPGLWPEGSPLGLALAGSRPVLWETHKDEALLQLTATWDDLDIPIKRFLERIPLDPPPDR